VLDSDLVTYVCVFAIAAAFVLARRWRLGSGVGLVLTYVIAFASNYLLAPALLLLPWYETRTADLTVRGMRESTIAMVAFAIGGEMLVAFRKHRQGVRVREVAAPEAPALVDRRIVLLYLLTGIVLYAFIFPIANQFASLTALAAAGSTLAVVAIGLLCWNAFHAGRRRAFALFLASSLLLPVMTVLGQGFLGYGFAGMLTVFAFVASFYTPRWRIPLVAILLGYVGLSVYVTYMRDRGEIRAVVWGGANVHSRLAQAGDTFSDFEWFDVRNQEHLYRVSVRLDQDVLIGAAERYIAGGSATFARGGTLRDAFLAVIPRAIWPNKPVVAGSGNLVSDYTGIHFVEGTSVGIGQVMESYVNFGETGVWMAFLVIGAVITLVDQNAADRIGKGQAGSFLMWYLPGQALLQVGGSFAEVTSTAAAAFVMTFVLSRLVRQTATDRRGKRRPMIAAGTEAKP
jgi:hypothetical protein